MTPTAILRELFTQNCCNKAPTDDGDGVCGDAYSSGNDGTRGYHYSSGNDDACGDHLYGK